MPMCVMSACVPLQLAALTLKSRCYNQMRATELLGYITHCNVLTTHQFRCTQSLLLAWNATPQCAVTLLVFFLPS